MPTTRVQNKYIFAIANQKGGVGKTTTAINLATATSAIGKRTLLIDLDPQGNASTGLGVEYSNRMPSIYEALINPEVSLKAVKPTVIPNFSIIPATVNLAAAEIELVNISQREFLLRSLVHTLFEKENFEICIIDCPPSLGMLTVNALTAATGIIIPLQCEFFALEGLVHLLNTINLIKKSYNPALCIDGILLTMTDKRNRLSTLVEKDVRETFKELVFNTVVPRNIKLSEAPSHGKPALIYDNKCAGSIAYMLLVKELLNRKDLLNIEENDAK